MNLKPIAANQNEVELENGITVFFSYRTPVAAHIPGEGFVKTDKKWSVTTSKHIGKFIARNGGSGLVSIKPQSYFDQLA
jgi:hypothetical protein